MGISINTKGIKTTAASRLVFDDLKVAEVIDELNAVSANLISATNEVGERKYDYTEAQDILAEAALDVTNRVSDSYDAELAKSGAKHVGAELERRIKKALNSDERYQRAQEEVASTRDRLHGASVAHEALKAEHRTLVAQANLVGQTLGFLAATKTARSAHLAALAEV